MVGVQAVTGMMRHAKKLLAYLTIGAALALVVSACDFPEFDPPNIIDTRRILAIKHVPRETKPGDTVTITALVVNGDGTLYEGSLGWLVSGSLALSEGETDELPDGEPYLQNPDSPPFSFEMPDEDEFAEHFGIGYDPEATVLTIGLAAGESQDDVTLAVKTLIVKDEPSKENPIFQRIVVRDNGQVLTPDTTGIYTVGPGAHLNLTAEVDFPTGEIEERSFHWYTATEGIDFGVDRVTTWDMPKEPGLYPLYCVARENTKTTYNDGETVVQSSGIDWSGIIVQIVDN